MKRIGNIPKIWLWLMLGSLALSPVAAQNTAATVWASVQFNKQQVAVGEPLVVTITVYTSTWFTSSPRFDEIQVPEAIMVEYEQRSGSLRKTVGKRTYPAIEKKFFVYPFRQGENMLPEMKIVVESPDEGDYKGKRRVIRSPERSFNVLPSPPGSKGPPSLTAYNVTLSEEWSGWSDELLQGDVLERRLTIRATGALAALIPPLGFPGGEFGNIYKQQASLSNAQQNDLITGTREERWSYLLEREGTFTIPGVSVSWYDPRSGSSKSFETISKEITIRENPNMEFLLTMQDSLQRMLQEETGGPDERFEWMGLNWWQFSLAILMLPAVAFLIYRFLLYIGSEFALRKVKRAQSELNQFQLLGQLAGQDDPVQFFNQLMKWYDAYRSRCQEPAHGLNQFVASSRDKELIDAYTRLNELLFAERGRKKWSGASFYAALKRFRRKCLSSGHADSAVNLPGINPF